MKILKEINSLEILIEFLNTFDTLALKIEVRLRGQSADSFTFRQEASQHLNSLNESNHPKADFLTFATLRPIAILDSFIRILSDKHIGILTGE